jgi:hypothetical protein
MASCTPPAIYVRTVASLFFDDHRVCGEQPGAVMNANAKISSVSSGESLYTLPVQAPVAVSCGRHHIVIGA